MKSSHRGPFFPRRSWSRDEAIKGCLPLVKSLVAQLRVAHGLRTSFDDLFAAGVVGLVEAAARFDPDRGVAFCTFAYLRVRGAILDSQRGESAGDVERSGARTELSDLVKKCPANTNALTTPDPDGRRASWVTARTAPGERASIEDIDESAPTPDEAVDRRRQSHRLHEAFLELPSSQQRVLELHYLEGESFADIGARLGICKPGAFRLHERALEKLREALGVDLEQGGMSSKVTS